VVVEFGEMPEHKVVATRQTMEIHLAQQKLDVELIGFKSGEGAPIADPEIVKWQETPEHRIGFSEVEASPDGRLRQDMTIETRTPNRSERFRVQMHFDDSTPRNAIAAVMGKIVRAVKGLAKRFRMQGDVASYNKQLARAIKKIKVRTKLDFEFSVGGRQGAGDIYIGQKGRAYGEQAPDVSGDASTCQSE
jgi:hypothetical protein